MENAAFASGAPMAVPPVAHPGAMRVLAVEEDPACLAALTQMLQRYGYQVTAMASADEALIALGNNPAGFDLVMSVLRTQGPGIDGFELLRRAATLYPIVMFSGVEPIETMVRVILAGASAFLTKPLREDLVRDVWQHVVRRRAAASSTAAAVADPPRSDVVARQDADTGTKRGAAGLDGAGEGGSDGRTTKRNKIYSSAELYASFVRAAEQLRGTEAMETDELMEGCGEHIPPEFQDKEQVVALGANDDYSPRGIQDLLEAQGIQLTIEEVTSHLEKYRRDCLANHLSSMPTGSLGLYMRPQGATDIYQRSLLSNGASPVGSGILGHESNRASHAGLLYNNGDLHNNANGNPEGNCIGKYGTGYDYKYGNGNGNGSDNDNANANGRGGILVANKNMVSASLPYDNANANGRGGILVANENMVSASLPSDLAQPVQQASSMIPTTDDPNPDGNCIGKYGTGYDYQYGNGNGNDNANANDRGGILVANENMVSASLSSDLAQPVQASSMIPTTDDPNPDDNCIGKYGTGYDYQYGNGNGNDNANDNGRGGILVANENMVSASLPSELAQPVQQASSMLPTTDDPNPDGNCIGKYGTGYDYEYGNGNGNDNDNNANANGRGGILVANENMVSAALPSDLAQPVQHASSMIPTTDDPNPVGEHAFPQISQLRYDSITGGISMVPLPVDDGEELLRSYLEAENDGEELLKRYLGGDNEVMQKQNTPSAGLAQGMHGDGAPGQISASQPQDLNELSSPENSNENGTVNISGRSDVVVIDGILDWDFSVDELEKFCS